MANTRIQIKRSSITATPAGGSLNAAEPAYSYSSNTLFIGGSDGVGVLPVGGKFYVDQQSVIFNVANAAYGQANSTSSAYSYSNTVAAAANAWANTVGTAGNNYTNSVGLAGNNYTNAVGTAGNNYTNTVGEAGNNYASILAANNAVGANSWANTVGTAGNNYTNAVAVAGNNYTVSVGVAGNNYSNTTFVKLTAPLQTITGDLAITGNLTFLGNSTIISSNNLVVGDSLIYLAANNYSGTDLLDIGFVANYANGTGANVHTGLVRDHVTKEYYLFQGLDVELQNNNEFTPGANGVVNATLNADIVANQIVLGGINVQPWVTAAFTAANSSNGWANTVGIAGNNYASILAANNAIGANAWANTVGTAGNNYTNAVGLAGNNYSATVGASANAWATAVGAAGNSYTNTVGTAGNNYTISVATAGNNYVNSLNTVIFQTFHDAANLTSGTLPSGRLSGSYTGITGVGTISTGTWQGSTVNVAYGGTGIVSATLNGVLFGSGGSGALQVTAAGTDGQVLQSNQGVPQFAMLDGGVF